MASFLLVTLCGNLRFHLFFFLPVQKLEIKCETFQISTSWGFVCVCMYPQLLQSCPTLCNPVDCSPPGFSVHGDSPGKNTRVGCHVLPPGDLHDPGIKPASPALQADSLLLSHWGRPQDFVYLALNYFHFFFFLREKDCQLVTNHIRCQFDVTNLLRLIFLLVFPGNTKPR